MMVGQRSLLTPKLGLQSTAQVGQEDISLPCVPRVGWWEKKNMYRDHYGRTYICTVIIHGRAYLTWVLHVGLVVDHTIQHNVNQR